ncbi:MAG TPA: hypothetical protein VMI13_13140 [Solirubrobacteraceae bacterium]|nr:hypothetical protein [Solirubrobacteraceae bacterium]
MSDLRSSPLFQYLKSREPVLAGKVEEVRGTVSAWLEYVPASFPQYTRHTIAHSDEIVRQLSRLIFNDEDPEQATLELSSSEAYILITGALLHDAGMVVPDTAKAAVLASPSWSEWIAASRTRQRQVSALEAFRAGDTPSDPTLRAFLADVRLRQLLSEFIRRTHHERVIPLLVDRETDLGRFAFGDPMLLQTIGAVCEGHGVARSDLDDRYHYPDRREVYGAEVNVRLMAILLRLGDLLDMSHDRACPLLQSAAAPLPKASVAHWNQYSRIRHRVTSPEMIELDAECVTADEHRLLQDWCQWIVDEVNGSRALLAGSKRHSGWTAPVARMGGPDATMFVRPAPGATYIPADWTFEVDTSAVLERFVSDVDTGALTFLRELLQNALDATRCCLSDLHYERHGTRPTDIRDVSSELRAQYPVRVVLADRTRHRRDADEEEEVCELSVEDLGVGMSQSTIQRYFLQIGRSYYTTPAFRESYRFPPTSRFGVGFLSVFRDSDHVVVETATGEDISGSTGGLQTDLGRSPKLHSH